MLKAKCLVQARVHVLSAGICALKMCASVCDSRMHEQMFPTVFSIEWLFCVAKCSFVCICSLQHLGTGLAQ